MLWLTVWQVAGLLLTHGSQAYAHAAVFLRVQICPNKSEGGGFPP